MSIKRATLVSRGLVLPALAIFFLAASPNPFAPDTPELGSVERIAQLTTDSRYLSPWVAYVPDSKIVPSPKKYLGRIMERPENFPTFHKSMDISGSWPKHLPGFMWKSSARPRKEGRSCWRP